MLGGEPSTGGGAGQRDPAHPNLDEYTYGELRQIARKMMAGERPGQTLQATALVHEAFLRLGGDQRWNSRAHFFGAAAEAMRRVLIDNARRKHAQKRGAGAEHTAWDDSRIEVGTPPEELMEIDEALGKLEAEDPDLARLVKIRYFAGMTVAETASALDVSERSVNRMWKCARAWLHREIENSR